MPTAEQIRAKIADNNKLMQTASDYDKKRMTSDNAKLQGMLDKDTNAINAKLSSPGSHTAILESGGRVVVDPNGSISQYGGKMSPQQASQIGTPNQQGAADQFNSSLADEYNAGKIKNVFDFVPGKGTQYNTGATEYSPFAVDLQTAARNAGQVSTPTTNPLGVSGTGTVGVPSALKTGASSGTSFGSLSQLTDSQKRAQDFINNPSSGFGNLDEYVQNNIDRFNRGDISYNALKADAERVGYSIPSQFGGGGTAGPGGTPIQNIEPKSPTDYSWITQMVNNELAQQQAAIAQELDRMKQANQLAVDQNNTFLQDSIKQLEDNRIKAGEAIKNFQNRRGGFYSGGVDFQNAHNNEAFAEQEGSVTKDVQARNADIWNRNALLAQQAAENLSQLQQQAPARIQQLVQQQMEKDRQAAIQEAGLTGIFNGQPTLAAQNQQFNQDIASQQLGIQQRTADLNEAELMATLTGFLPDGTPTNAQQQQILDNAWNTITEIGYVPTSLAQIVGVPAGTKTQDAIKTAISQQNANTSSKNAETSRMNADRGKQQLDNEQSIKAKQAEIMDGIAQFDTAAEASDWLNANAKSITENLGADTFAELKKMLPLFFGEDTSGDQAVASQRVRQQAIDLAQKDNRWKDPKGNKEALIQEYVKLLSGS